MVNQSVEMHVSASNALTSLVRPTTILGLSDHGQSYPQLSLYVRVMDHNCTRFTGLLGDLLLSLDSRLPWRDAGERPFAFNTNVQRIHTASKL